MCKLCDTKLNKALIKLEIRILTLGLVFLWLAVLAKN